MKGEAISGISVAWIAMALGAFALAAYCGLSVSSDQQALSAQIADLQKTQELALELAALPKSGNAEPGELASAIRSLLEQAGVADVSDRTIRSNGPTAVPSTTLSLTQVRVSLTQVALPQLIRFLQLRETEHSDVFVSEVKLNLPKVDQQKTPEQWAAEVTLTYPGEAR